MSKPDLTIAVLLTYEAQLLDMSPIDLFGMLDKTYLQEGLPAPVVKLGLDIQIHYIGNGSNQHLTAQAKLVTDSTLQDDHVQPGKIDILLIPGPPPSKRQPRETLDFVAAHGKHGTTILTVCTGCIVAAEAGVLDGCQASAPRGLVPRMRRDFQKVLWDDQRRWVKHKTEDGEIWTSGGITNGLEMVAAYIKEKYPGPLSETVCAMADVGDKGELYDSPVVVETAWWIGQVFRALLFGRKR